MDAEVGMVVWLRCEHGCDPEYIESSEVSVMVFVEVRAWL